MFGEEAAPLVEGVVEGDPEGARGQSERDRQVAELGQPAAAADLIGGPEAPATTDAPQSTDIPLRLAMLGTIGAVQIRPLSEGTDACHLSLDASGRFLFVSNFGDGRLAVLPIREDGSLVEVSEHANVPSTQTCMNCHSQIRTESVNLLPVRESWATGEPVQWVRVHHLPDYAQFPHAPHVNVGVGCESCHGRVDQMEVVQVAEPLSMGWCLDCHRNPEEHLRDPALVTQMGYNAQVRASDEAFADYVQANEARIRAEGINPPENCSACHY